jgi:hypothetical protein
MLSVIYAECHKLDHFAFADCRYAKNSGALFVLDS